MKGSVDQQYKKTYRILKWMSDKFLYKYGTKELMNSLSKVTYFSVVCYILCRQINYSLNWAIISYAAVAYA